MSYGGGCSPGIWAFVVVGGSVAGDGSCVAVEVVVEVVVVVVVLVKGVVAGVVIVS